MSGFLLNMFGPGAPVALEAHFKHNCENFFTYSLCCNVLECSLVVR